MSSLEQQVQHLLDLQAIRDLCFEYCRAADEADGDAWAAVFTEDGEFEIIGDKVYRGREELAEKCRSAREIIHIGVDSKITIDGDTAKHEHKMIAFHRNIPRDAMEFASTLTVTDSYVKKSGKWLIKRRTSDLDIDFRVAGRRLALI